MPEEMNCQLVQAEENLIAQWTLDGLAVHFDQVQLECLDVGELREAAQWTR